MTSDNKTLDEIRDELASEFHTVEGYSDQHRQMFRHGFDASTAIWKERTDKLVKVLEYYSIYRDYLDRSGLVGHVTTFEASPMKKDAGHRARQALAELKDLK